MTTKSVSSNTHTLKLQRRRISSLLLNRRTSHAGTISFLAPDSPRQSTQSVKAVARRCRTPGRAIFESPQVQPRARSVKPAAPAAHARGPLSRRSRPVPLHPAALAARETERPGEPERKNPAGARLELPYFRGLSPVSPAPSTRATVRNCRAGFFSHSRNDIAALTQGKQSRANYKERGTGGKSPAGCCDASAQTRIIARGPSACPGRGCARARAGAARLEFGAGEPFSNFDAAADGALFSAERLAPR